MFLFVVEQVFPTSLGVVLVPGHRTNRARAGTSIRLVRPDRSTIDTKIKGIEFESGDILLGPDVRNEEVLVGTEVWLIEAPLS